MANRLNLQTMLEKILGSRNVYFQPPESKKLSYPCIIYSFSGKDIKCANDMLYQSTNRYEIVVIDMDSESMIPDHILRSFPMCRLDRAYTSENLYHYIITLYF